jgi:flavin reductase (DIM6/NTAB) family NADH-FMN oxidoreductase RutF
MVGTEAYVDPNRPIRVEPVRRRRGSVHDARGCLGAPAGVDPDCMRRALRDLVSTVTVITTVLDGRPWGLTVSAFAPVCLDPPTVLVCVNRETATARCIAADNRFGINVLADHQSPLSDRCAAPGAPKFLTPDELLTDGDPAPTVPTLRDSLVSFECTAASLHVGTHLVVLGRVLAMFTNPTSRPLLYGDGHYQRAEPLDRDLRPTNEGRGNT